MSYKWEKSILERVVDRCDAGKEGKRDAQLRGEAIFERRPGDGLPALFVPLRHGLTHVIQ